MTSELPRLLTCVGVESDLDLLPHWLAHYHALGVAPERTHVILNAGAADAPGLSDARALLREAGCAEPEVWIAPYTSDAMWDRRRALQTRVAGPDDWVLSADVDEFHAYPEALDNFLARCDALGADCVQGVFVDRLAPGGQLASVAPRPGALAQFPVMTEVGWTLFGQGTAHDINGTIKIMAMKGRVLPSRGGHHPVQGQRAAFLYGGHLRELPGIERAEVRFAIPTRVYHLHWTESLPDRLRRRLATPGVSPAGAEYGRKQLDYLARHGGINLDHVPPAPRNLTPGPSDILRVRRRLLARRPLRLARNLLRRIGS